MKSLALHYQNKYPDGHVNHTESSLDAYDNAGALVVSLRRDGHGKIVDQSKENGALDSHDMCPIPKNARVHKLCGLTGHMKLDEKAAERKAAALKLAVDGKVLSIKEYKEKGYLVSEDGSVSKKAARDYAAE